MSVPRNPLHLIFLIFFLLFSAPLSTFAAGSDPDPLPPSITTAPLSVTQVVDNLLRCDQERAHALRHYESTRLYHLAYRGFLADRDAEMTVHATYDSPSTKRFQIVSQTGSKLIVDRVLKRLLDTEREAAAEPELHEQTLVNRDNYRIALIGFEPARSSTGSTDQNGQYVLAVAPKIHSKYAYRGKVWVDAADFAITRIDAEPAQSPSFWTKKIVIHHEYMKVGDFWLPRRNESVSYIRLGGQATLTIDYSNYRVNGSPASVSASPPASSANDGGGAAASGRQYHRLQPQ